MLFVPNFNHSTLNLDTRYNCDQSFFVVDMVDWSYQYYYIKEDNEQ